MRWEDAPRSDNIEDRRGDGGGGGGGFSLPIGGGGLGIGTIIILAIIGYATGIDPRILIGGAEVITGHGGGSQYSQNQYTPNQYTEDQPAQSRAIPPQQANSPRQSSHPTDQMGDFVAAVLGETETVWSQVLPDQKGVAYVKPRLVLYSGVDPLGLRPGASRHGAVLLPDRQEGLSRHGLLQRHEAATRRRRRLRLCLCDRA